jgi:hypothetical protein
MADDFHSGSPPARRRLPGCVIGLLYLLLGLALLIGLPWTYLTIKWQRQLDRRLAPLRAAGQPLTMAQAAPPMPPASENAAVVYQQVFQVSFAGNSQGPSAFPVLSQQEQALLDGYLKSRSPSQDQAVGVILARPEMRQTLQILERASAMPQCVFPVRRQDGLAARFPHRSVQRQAVRLPARRGGLCGV